MYTILVIGNRTFYMLKKPFVKNGEGIRIENIGMSNEKT